MTAIAMIRDSAGAVAPRGDLARIRALRFTRPGFDPATWRQMGEMGWIGLRLPEEAGGAGLGLAEYVALAEEMGRGLVPEPLVQGVLSATLLAACGAETALAPLLAGETLPLTAWQEAPDTLAAPGTPGGRRYKAAATGSGCRNPYRAGGSPGREPDCPGTGCRNRVWQGRFRR
ncbi:MAG: hypothetical protein B7Z53_00210 [Rhodospirillales bacterium 12-71-4]|nr:MAG: hypothetical protein B7Z53_00210 [Rhodospirillales bacterium 12-71-4]